ncbi:MAG: hypothetical protein ABI401_16845 [Candidatus Dormibacter sp.]
MISTLASRPTAIGNDGPLPRLRQMTTPETASTTPIATMAAGRDSWRRSED